MILTLPTADATSCEHADTECNRDAIYRFRKLISRLSTAFRADLQSQRSPFRKVPGI
jgi:hypothetical protein